MLKLAIWAQLVMKKMLRRWLGRQCKPQWQKQLGITFVCVAAAKANAPRTFVALLDNIQLASMRLRASKLVVVLTT